LLQAASKLRIEIAIACNDLTEFLEGRHAGYKHQQSLLQRSIHRKRQLLDQFYAESFGAQATQDHVCRVGDHRTVLLVNFGNELLDRHKLKEELYNLGSIRVQIHCSKNRGQLVPRAIRIVKSILVEHKRNHCTLLLFGNELKELHKDIRRTLDIFSLRRSRI